MINKFCFVIGAAMLFTVTISKAQVASATIKGTPYMSETYEEGVIYYANNNVKVPARYNIYKDLIEYQQNGKAMVLDPSATIKKVQLPKATFVSEKYSVNGKTKYGYFNLLDSGKVMLYSKKLITYVPERKGGALDGSDQPAEFKKGGDVFYIKIGDNNLEEVKNIKSMISLFPDKQEELTSFAKKEKISPKKEDELIKFVQYYNSL